MTSFTLLCFLLFHLRTSKHPMYSEGHFALSTQIKGRQKLLWHQFFGNADRKRDVHYQIQTSRSPFLVLLGLQLTVWTEGLLEVGNVRLLSAEVRQGSSLLVARQRPAGCDEPEVESQRLVISADTAVCSSASLDTQYVGSIVPEGRG